MASVPIQYDPEMLRRSLAIAPQIPQNAMAGPPPSITASPSATPAPDLGISTARPIQAPRGTIPGDEAERTRLMSTGSGISQIPSKIENSQFGQAHPTLGKIAGYGLAGLAGLGDLGLTTLGGGIGRLAEQQIPGTFGHHQVLLNQANRSVAQDEANAEKESTTAKTAEETAEMPAEAKAKDALEASTANLQGSEAEAKKQPDLSRAYAAAVDSAMQRGADPSQDPVVQHLADSITSIQRQPLPKGEEHVDLVGPGGKPIAATFDPSTGQYKGSSGKVIPNPEPYEKPNQAGMVTVVAPDPNNPGGGIIERLGAGAKIAPGTQTMSGVNAENTPTMQQRTAAGRAATVVAMAPEVLGRIDSLKGKLGPMEGRWNEFMQGKVGMDDPDFAALRSDLLMMSSAVALAHAQGRLPENLREEFDHAINAPKQTPENLKATIQTMIPWLQQMQSQGQKDVTPAQPAQGGSPAIGAVEGGYRFKGGNPADQKNWEKAQ
jgi:hypothetical protein